MAERNNAEQIFNEACGLAGAAREEYLRNACGDDVSLRAAVDSLLAADSAAGDFLAGGETNALDATVPMTPASAHRAPPTPGEQPGARIGRYKLLQQIGEADSVSSGWRNRRSPSAAESRSRSSNSAWTRARSSLASKPSDRRSR
ncbi:MAG TPA: hypothetical protein PK093_16220 [Phycisphaerae bacterium]|nr:hypothetical protein [Phycisphaerae bacterium]